LITVAKNAKPGASHFRELFMIAAAFAMLVQKKFCRPAASSHY
jgi:hypothetical protein